LTHLTKTSRERRTIHNEKEDTDIVDLLLIWPKMVEYADLSEYESKVYLSLLGLGCSGARKLSITCNVPKTKVYGTLKKLIDYGLVVEIPGTPKYFAPASPIDAFSATLKRVKNKAHDFSTILETLTRTHELITNESSPKKKIVWYIDKDDDIMGKCHEMISQSEETLDILTSADGLSLLFNSAPRLLDKVKDEGVEVRLCSPLCPRTNPLARELAYLFEVKKVDISTPLLFIDSDHRRFVLAKLDEQDMTATIEFAVFSDDSIILSLMSLLMVDMKRKSTPKTKPFR
jgi:sugar-specific transcriptional regulator TrmB